MDGAHDLRAVLDALLGVELSRAAEALDDDAAVFVNEDAHG